MTYQNPNDPAIGKVHRERRGLTQHYLLSGWRGIEYRLTGRFAGIRLQPFRNEKNRLVTPIKVVSEHKGHDGSLLWSDQDGNHYPDLTPREETFWTETIDWPVGDMDTLKAGLSSLLNKPVQEMSVEELRAERRALLSNMPTFAPMVPKPKE